MSLKPVRDQLIAKIRLELRYKTEEELLNFVLSLDKERLNTQVPDEEFPAWDIAYRLKVNHWEMSDNQRKALLNVTSHYLTDDLFECALAGRPKKVTDVLNNIQTFV